ncbi:hypothetical protein M758_UG166800 [Ceratodon purpureus]|nr:hypothetical protein M758_UG166800 [Ceratodon purpureus]
MVLPFSPVLCELELLVLNCSCFDAVDRVSAASKF